ncbi:MAG: hypothetical protein AAF911_02090 [Planctomycetota bacterium]
MKLPVNDKTYTVVDGDTEGLSSRIDWSENLLIKSPDLTPPEAVSAVVAMYLKVCQEQLDAGKIIEPDIAEVTSRIESYFLTPDAETDSQNPTTPSETRRGGVIPQYAVFAGAALAVGLIVTGCWLATRNNARPTPVVLAVGTDGFLSHKSMAEVEFDRLIIDPIVHPHLPVFFTAEGNRVWRVEHDGTRELLAAFSESILGLNISWCGRYVTVVDVGKQVYRVESRTGDVLSLGPQDGLPVKAYAWDHAMAWNDALGNVWWYSYATREVEKWTEVSHIVVAASHPTLIAVEYESEFRLMTSRNTLLMPLKLDGQEVSALDASGDLSSIVLATTQGEVRHYQRKENGYSSRSIMLPIRGNLPRIRLGPHGRFAYVGENAIYRINLAEMKLDGSVDVDLATGEMLSGLMVNDRGTLAAVHKEKGISWQD